MTCNLLAKSDLYLSMKVSLRISDVSTSTENSDMKFTRVHDTARRLDMTPNAGIPGVFFPDPQLISDLNHIPELQIKIGHHTHNFTEHQRGYRQLWRDCK